VRRCIEAGAGWVRAALKPARGGPQVWLCKASLTCLLAACAAPPVGVPVPVAALPAAPEISTGLNAKPGWAFQRMAVAAANPLAAEAGYQILRAGGNALDAAIAVQMVLALVEPQSSGIGGGAFLLHWNGNDVSAWDGRETAPAAAEESLFLLADGKPMPMPAAMVGGRAVGVPGAVRMLEAAHRAGGRLPWARLFEPAIALAEQGFALSARLHAQIKTDAHLAKDPLARRYFFAADGQALPVGHVLRNPALAALLRAIATQGSAALHEGPAAADWVARVHGHALNPGRVTLADMAAYQALRREPLCTEWLTIYRVCGFPPPSSGHLTVMQMLGLLERLPPALQVQRPVAAPLGSPPLPKPEASPGPQPIAAPSVDSVPAGAMEGGIPSAAWLHTYAEAARLAFADRNHFIADPAFAPAPGGDWRSLLAPAYLAQRARLIGPQSMGRAQPGNPGVMPVALASMPDQSEHGTSHISVVDAQGGAVALTTSIEAQFGARLMSDGGTGLPGGYLLNNQLTDFSFTPADEQGRPVANRVQPGKRPRSSMSPTLVFDARDGRLLMTLGSPGGAAIIHFTAKTLVASLAWGLDAQAAINLPNFGNFNGPTLLEAGRFPPATVAALKARGHTVLEVEQPSGLQAIRRTPAGWFGGADPRREGIVRGE
jgi:gamma-glutamyltranspeptidase / glutathione hydrolase